ncbi:MAG: phosphoribosyl-AMP cyclohydrolase [Candidatus Staskawiczbacteria bacterium]|nr:phosphoribosyl-AMP cyclohydrolase [Candidatus Staskawiczbacteria bacterium]
MRILCPNFEKRDGLVTVVAQDVQTGGVLMVAFTDRAGFEETLATGKAVYFSTSRNERWMKGETSGDFQIVKDVLVDCDGDAIIYLVEQKGDGACHTKAKSCFYRSVLHDGLPLMDAPKSGKKEDLPFVDLKVHDSLNPYTM